jgi:hypothetical protein
MIFPDGKSGRLRCRGLRAGYVHELDVAALRSRAGVAMAHPKAYYTVNRIPTE